MLPAAGEAPHAGDKPAESLSVIKASKIQPLVRVPWRGMTSPHRPGGSFRVSTSPYSASAYLTPGRGEPSRAHRLDSNPHLFPLPLFSEQPKQLYVTPLPLA